MPDIDSLFPDNPRRQEHGAITAENISHQLCEELVNELDEGDFELNDWQAKFIESNLGHSYFSVKQKAVIYDMAFKFKLL